MSCLVQPLRDMRTLAKQMSDCPADRRGTMIRH